MRSCHVVCWIAIAIHGRFLFDWCVGCLITGAIVIGPFAIVVVFAFHFVCAGGAKFLGESDEPQGLAKPPFPSPCVFLPVMPLTFCGASSYLAQQHGCMEDNVWVDGRPLNPLLLSRTRRVAWQSYVPEATELRFSFCKWAKGEIAMASKEEGAQPQA